MARDPKTGKFVKSSEPKAENTPEKKESKKVAKKEPKPTMKDFEEAEKLCDQAPALKINDKRLEGIEKLNRAQLLKLVKSIDPTFVQLVNTSNEWRRCAVLMKEWKNNLKKEIDNKNKEIADVKGDLNHITGEHDKCMTELDNSINNLKKAKDALEIEQKAHEEFALLCEHQAASLKGSIILQRVIIVLMAIALLASLIMIYH